MLDSLARLQLGVDLGGGSGCWKGLSQQISSLIRWCTWVVGHDSLWVSPAAAAGSTGDFAGDATVSRSLDRGLLSRTESSLRAEGDRERRSNLDVFLGSGSF